MEEKNTKISFGFVLGKKNETKEEDESRNESNFGEEGKTEEIMQIIPIVDEKGINNLQKIAKSIPLPKNYNRKRAERKIEEKFQNDTSIKEVKFTPGLHLMGEKRKIEMQEDDVPLTMLNRLNGIDEIKEEDKKLKHDVENRPDSNNEDYGSMPVEEFGKAMLRGMGWKEGGSIGLSNPTKVKPIEYVPRAGRLGLGADPKKDHTDKLKFLKPGDKILDNTMVAPLSSEGKIRHYKHIDEKLVAVTPRSIHVGCNAEVVSGVHKEMIGKVKSIEKGFAILSLKNGQSLKVELSHLKMLNDHEYRNRKRSPELISIVDEKRKEKPRKEISKKEKKDSKRKKKEDYWIIPNILVRIISKKFLDGKHYNQKVVIFDVYKEDECQVQLPNGKLLDGVKQSFLETVCPQKGEKVLILKGKQKGTSAVIVERDSKKNKVVVKTREEEISLTFDDISSIPLKN